MGHTLLASRKVGSDNIILWGPLLGLRPPERLQLLITGSVSTENRLEKRPKTVRDKSEGLVGGFPNS